MASDGLEVASTPEEPQSVSRPVSCEKEQVSEPRKKSPEARSTAGKKSRERRLSPKPKTSRSKRKRSKRSKFVYSSPSSSDSRKPRAPTRNLARPHQAAILGEILSANNNMASPSGLMKMAFRSRNKCSILLSLQLFRACQSPKEKT